MTWIKRFIVPVTLGVAIVLTFSASLLPRFDLFLAGQLALLIIVTAALVLLMGGAGLLSLSSAAFLGVGAYGSIILVERLQIPLLIALPAIAVVGGLVGWLLGLVSLRLSGFYLAIVTLGFIMILLIVMKQGGELTGSGYGLIAPTITLPVLGDLNAQSFALIAVFLSVLAVSGAATLMRSRFGRSWLALRDNEPAALMQGINVRGAKLRAFALSSAVISGAGGVFAFLLGSANPGSFTTGVSIFHIALVVVGGLTGGLVGAVVAPIVLFLLPEIFDFGEYRDLFYAGLLLAVLVFVPSGISGAFTTVTKRLRLARRRSEGADK